jgi:anti-sigma regulatory factor (Ser/Thr protein kinase)
VTVLQLPAELASVRAARRALVGACREAGLPADLADSAELMISEVVTNAVFHGRSAVMVEVDIRSKGLRVEVTDDGEELPRMQPLDDAVPSGRGLRIVAVLASDWGIATRTRGKTVWFELAGD